MSEGDSQKPADVWATGATYEPYVGRWSRVVAREFLDWLGVRPGGGWLDVGCGTGALTQTILATAAPARVHAVDSSFGYVAHARAHVAERRVAFAVADARALPLAAQSTDAVVSGLMLNFIPDPELAVAEMVRAACVGGTVAAYVWDYAAGMQMIRLFWDAVVALDPAATALDEGRRFPLCHPAALAALWRGAGLRGVEERALEVPTRFRDFDDYWTPFLGGQGPAPSYVQRLAEGDRARLRECLRAKLPAASSGAITLSARAWAVRGTRP